MIVIRILKRHVLPAAATALVAAFAIGLGTDVASADDRWTLDKSYGRGGFTKDAPVYMSGMTLNQRGGVIGVGASGDKYDSISALGFKPDGSPDVDFGRDGDGWAFLGPNNYNAYPQAVAVDSKDRILIAGAGTGYLSGLKLGPELLRLNPNGTRDKTFRPQSAFSFSGFGYTDVAPLPNGKLLASGGFEDARGVKAPAIVIRQFKEDGKRDLSFGKRGTVTIKGPKGKNAPETGASNIHVLPSGKFLVSGIYANRPWIGRFHPGGRPDRSFSRNGSVTANIEQESGCTVNLSCAARGLAVVRGGSIRMLANRFINRRRSKPLVIGFTKNGRPDLAYGDKGRVSIRPNEFRHGAENLIGLPDGSVLVTLPSISMGALARVSSDGDQVSNFGALRKDIDWVITGEFRNDALFLSGGRNEESVIWKLRRL